jgi:DNA modification methylase
MTFTLHQGDCLELLTLYADNSIDSIVTDPPYGLSFMGKKWDYDVPSVEIWKECLRVLKPGGHLLSFSSARTYHRMTCNVEDAGFEIRDQLMWVYGSGFPKNHNVGKYIHKLKTDGCCREVKNKGVGNTNGKFFVAGKHLDNREETPSDNEWEGWGTALKPAHEPIVLARKPFKQSVAKNVLEHGTGAINIDGCRVPSDEPITINTFDNGAKPFGDAVGEPYTSRQSEGRFPANFIHNGIDEEWSHYFYCPKANKKERGDNNHPTVKPINLMTYLCRLITPPGGTVLDPFMGSGSTGIASVKEGFQFIGIELDPEYLQIAKHRINELRTKDPST